MPRRNLHAACIKTNNIMNDEIKTIHEFDFSLICEYFSMLERQGPGSRESTLRALSFAGNLTDRSRIADIGCGTGGQTMVLAQNAPGRITGVDLFPDFIKIFNENAARLGLGDRVKGITGDMTALPFDDESLDLIWSEGAIYNIGFERGLTEWRRLLKPGGYIAVSEASWFTPERPAEIETFWNAEYPFIDTVPNQVAVLQECGYVPVAAFMLPPENWSDKFYQPQAEAQLRFLQKHRGNKAAEDFIANMRHEAELFTRFGEYYGYTFFIGRKR
jgi:ubiquinone/menaquinone biosynthesis C-methylase UbiE